MTADRDSLSASFRDPSGFLFRHLGQLFRQVNESYRENYDLLIASGLYRKLASAKLLVEHEESGLELACAPGAYKVLRPALVPFISYPYEWCFGQLKDAALLTLQIQKIALEHGMSLKDASAYNVQFAAGRPLFIDSLSFEKFPEGRPWVAYRQFCQHFLAPLALMSCRDVRLNQMLKLYLDGIPLDLASRLLPSRTRLKFSLLSHIHLHAKSQKRYEHTQVRTSERRMSRFSLLALINSLETAVARLQWRPRGSEWADYYENTNYSDSAGEFKKQRIVEFLQALNPRQVWDIGANTGIYSRLASGRGIPTVALDIDPAAVEKNYRQCRREGDRFLLPLVSDITNPSPGIGWENRERMPLLERGPADAVLALALVHHLAISNNLPLAKIAAFFSRLCRALVVEFIPKEDSQVRRLLATREDIFPDYNAPGFEKEFSRYFQIERAEKIPQSERTLYLMRVRDGR